MELLPKGEPIFIVARADQELKGKNCMVKMSVGSYVCMLALYDGL